MCFLDYVIQWPMEEEPWSRQVFRGAFKTSSWKKICKVEGVQGSFHTGMQCGKAVSNRVILLVTGPQFRQKHRVCTQWSYPRLT